MRMGSEDMCDGVEEEEEVKEERGGERGGGESGDSGQL